MTTTAPEGVPWWFAVPAFALALVALAMWLHDAAHVTFLARWVDGRRKRRADALHTTKRAGVARLREAREAREAEEADRQRREWQSDSFVAVTSGPEKTLALRLAPPGNRSPIDFHETYATCEVWRGGNRFASEPTLYRYNLGYQAAFPQDFSTSPKVPGWWLTLPTECRVVWRDAEGAVLRDYVAVIPERRLRQ